MISRGAYSWKRRLTWLDDASLTLLLFLVNVATINTATDYVDVWLVLWKMKVVSFQRTVSGFKIRVRSWSASASLPPWLWYWPQSVWYSTMSQPALFSLRNTSTTGRGDTSRPVQAPTMRWTRRRWGYQFPFHPLACTFGWDLWPNTIYPKIPE